jgi:hypothetical protein
VKWGVGRFWNPTDYLHPVKRDPLAVFDPRLGTAMVKLHLPWEARGWNAYGVAVFEDIAGVPAATRRLGRLGVGGRAEVVLGPMELGLDALAQDGHRPRFGVDVSAGVWDLDVYAEAAIRTSVDTPRWREAPGRSSASSGTTRGADRAGRGRRNYAVKYSTRTPSRSAPALLQRQRYDSRASPLLQGVGARASIPPRSPRPPQVWPVRRSTEPVHALLPGRHYGGAFVSRPRRADGTIRRSRSPSSATSRTRASSPVSTTRSSP